MSWFNKKNEESDSGSDLEKLVEQVKSVGLEKIQDLIDASGKASSKGKGKSEETESEAEGYEDTELESAHDQVDPRELQAQAQLQDLRPVFEAVAQLRADMDQVKARL